MDKIFKMIVIFTLFYFSGCTHSPQQSPYIFEKKPKKQEKSRPAKIKKHNVYPPPFVVKPVVEEISPLEGQYFTFSADNAPLKTVLYAFAKDTGFNLIISPEVDPNIPITANFNNTPAKTALDIITEIAGVWYEVKDNVIFIKATKTKIFHLPYVHTNSQYNVNLGGDVLGSGATGTSGGTGATGVAGGTGGSYGGTSYSAANIKGEFSLKYESPEEINNFYDRLEESVASILGVPISGQGTAILSVSLKGKKILNSYTLNRFTGTLIVTATRDKMKKIEKLLKSIKKEIKKQVIIEAKIIEVTLSKEFKYGIDWNLLMKNFLGTGGSVRLVQNLRLGSGYGQVFVTGADFQSILDILEKTGKIETLSNPRIRVINGQTALISSGLIIPFWEKYVSTVTGTAAAQQVYYTRSNVLDGVMLGVTPYIENGEIMMNIVPVSTKIEDIRQLVDNNQVVAEAPVLNVKEAGTIVKVHDGDLIIIGGLIGTEKRRVVSKVPGLGDIPGLGALFRREEILKQKKELIIFLRPHIITVD
ncbi:hypothetical protein GWK41_00920 [Persephonella atlantica]|uniref:Type II/III secretion system secretin-like domain-containing protein n=1 Tax=Persephonella atlantica TaxID=2699429 RepID=A0ABS1GFB3_9AQUI|nr:hypothetical protein [Persephonella atlantica]MBK3331623.1 hypothetical protein [Persephonella atlantica]